MLLMRSYNTWSPSVMTGAAGLPPASDWDTSNTAEEAAVPMQLTASQRYTDTGFSRLACRANTSPATNSPNHTAHVAMFRPPDLISSPSLYQRSAGEGMPTTLHSRLTVPCSVRPATNSSRNTGAL